MRYGKYKSSFLKRLGVGFPRVYKKGDGPIVWAHAVSVGECRAICALLRQLQTDIGNATFVLSVTTETGYEEAKKIGDFVDHIVFMPFDFFLCVRFVLSRCAPDLLLLSEGDFWYGFLDGVKSQGGAVCVVNGKISETSCRRLAAVSFFTKRLFSLIDLFCVQAGEYRDRFCSLGVPADKIKVSGNIKSDIALTPISNEERALLQRKLHIAPDDLVLVIGSTHDPEEDLLLGELAGLFSRYPNFKIILVPRHPERFVRVEECVAKHGLRYMLWSKCDERSTPQIILVDAMGVLGRLYQLADIAIVAGSFTQKVGGHNILEPQAFGVATVVGPHTYTQQELVQRAIAVDALVQVPLDDIYRTIDVLLADIQARRRLGENGLAYYKSLQGAVKNTCQGIRSVVPHFFD